MIIILIKQSIILLLLVIISDTVRSETLSVSIDNDGPFGTDRDYTSGFQLSYSKAFRSGNSLLANYSPVALFTNPKQNTNKWRVTAGQKIWTPTYLTIYEPVPNERPYSGLLYIQGDIISLSQSSIHAFAFLAGITGPRSYAEHSQATIHRAAGFESPKGWDNQIEEKSIINLAYSNNYRIAYSGARDSLSHELSIPTRITAGNFRSEVAMGAIWRWGKNLQDSLGSATAENEMNFKPHMIKGNASGGFVFAGAEARYRFYDITINGDRPDSVYSTALQELQGTLVTGAALYGKNYGANASLTMKSRDFEQDNHRYFAHLSMSFFWMY